MFLSCAEFSGDLHGSSLARALKRQSPELSLVGIGGEKLRAASVNVLMDSTHWGVIGGTEVLKIIPALYRRLGELKKIFLELKPDAVVLVDYPGFHYRVAKTAKEAGLKVFYYIPPMLWGRKGNRGAKMAKVCDLIMPIFPQEEKLYQAQGARAVFVGHPLRDETVVRKSRDEIRRDFGMGSFSPVVGLLPGSRDQEMKSLFPAMLGAAQKIRDAHPECFFPVACALPHLKPRLEEVVSSLTLKGFPVKIIEGRTHEVMKACDFLMCASGTVTLEAALLGTPLVILYKVSALTAFLAKKFVLKDVVIGLPNIVSGEVFVPELLQENMKPDRIASTVLSYLNDESKLAGMREKLAGVRDRLASGNAAENAASLILKEISRETSAPSPA